MKPFVTKPFILASQSPRRKQLLEWACADFEVVISDENEDFDSSMECTAVAVDIAKRKAEAVWLKTGKLKPVVAADTIVVCEGEIIGKPADRQEAISILSKLSGKSHRVVTGVAIRSNRGNVEFADETFVHFHELSKTQIEFYVDHFKPYDKAGAYAIQEWIGVVGIKSIEGDFYNVMGLPVSRVLQTLKTLGFTQLPFEY